MPVSLPGRLFFGAAAKECSVVNLSCTGAGVVCDDAAPDADAILYIEHLGRVPVMGRRRENGVLGLEFDCTERKRWELGLAIAQYMTSGVTQLTRLRRRDRLAVSDICMTRPNGETVRCDAMDISSTGVSLRTTLRPAIGESVQIEGICGRVVRHLANGIAVELVRTGPSAVVPFPRGFRERRDDPPDGAA